MYLSTATTTKLKFVMTIKMIWKNRVILHDHFVSERPKFIQITITGAPMKLPSKSDNAKQSVHWQSTWRRVQLGWRRTAFLERLHALNDECPLFTALGVGTALAFKLGSGMATVVRQNKVPRVNFLLKAVKAHAVVKSLWQGHVSKMWFGSYY